MKRLGEAQAASTKREIQRWWEDFWRARPEHEGHGVVEMRRGMWDGQTLVCSCGDHFSVTGKQLALMGA